MTHAASPALHTDNSIAFVEHTKLDRVHDAPFETLVDVFLPGHIFEALRLVFGKEEWVDAAVEVGVARGTRVTSNHDDGTDGTVLADQASRVAAITYVLMNG